MGNYHIDWQQIGNDIHQQGMRLECKLCGIVEYFGDSPDGDRRLFEARDSHQCT